MQKEQNVSRAIYGNRKNIKKAEWTINMKKESERYTYKWTLWWTLKKVPGHDVRHGFGFEWVNALWNKVGGTETVQKKFIIQREKKSMWIYERYAPRKCNSAFDEQCWQNRVNLIAKFLWKIFVIKKDIQCFDLRKLNITNYKYDKLFRWRKRITKPKRSHFRVIRQNQIGLF